MKTELFEIEGVVEEIIFASQETGFTVLELNNGEELIVVVGELFGVNQGEQLKVTGEFVNHPTHGHQLKAHIFERSMPATTTAIKKYLSSGSVKGIGPSIASRIVDKFGDETLEILEKQPERLAEIKGISVKKARDLGYEFQQVFGIRAVMLFLEKHNINPSQSIKVWKKWGLSAIDIITENPYFLCDDDINISFSIADSIAKNFGMNIDNSKRIKSGLSYVLFHNLSNGHTCLPKEQLITLSNSLLEVDGQLIGQYLEELIENKILIEIQKNKPFVMLANFYLSEQYIASRLTVMSNTVCEKYEDVDLLIDEIENQNGIIYEVLQRQAIKYCLENQIFILTGGPGTGKTTTLNGIINIFEMQGLKVEITAPTGRAAKRIAEVTGRNAKTIHRILECEFNDGERAKFSKNEQNPLDCDVVLVDEMSMVDTILFDSLLRAIPFGAKIILVGDCDQLPSVGAGNILKDIISSECIPCVELKEIFRQAAKSLIVTNAHNIVSGKMLELSKKDNDFFFISCLDKNLLNEKVVELCSVRLPKAYKFSSVEDIQVLCPQRKGDIGVNELNKKLQEAINPYDSEKQQIKLNGKIYRENDKVMQIKNNYNIGWTKEGENGLGIYNGDIGIIKLVDKKLGIIVIDFDGREANYTFEMTNELDLAYATTVHKSQGSEFEAVVIPIIGGYDNLYFRNLLYTAVTRAKKLLILIGSKQRIEFMVNNNRKMLRYTCLKQFIQQFNENYE